MQKRKEKGLSQEELAETIGFLKIIFSASKEENIFLPLNLFVKYVMN